MNTLDIVLGLILIIAFFMGFRKGLLRALSSLIGLVAAVYAAMFFSHYVEAYLIRWFEWRDLDFIASFLITFVLIMIAFSLLGRILTKVADFVMLGIFNKIFGGLFSMLKYAFLISVIFMFVNSTNNYRILSPEKRDSSILYEPIASIAPSILPEIMTHVDDLMDPKEEDKNEQVDTIEEKSTRKDSLDTDSIDLYDI